MEVFGAMKGRRSIRKYESRDIPNELVAKVIEAATWAPSSKNRQPWEFIVIRDPETKRRIAELAPYGKFLAEAPVAVAIITDPAKLPWFYEVDGASAAQNFALAANALGLATCWVGTMDREAAKALLAVPHEKNLLTVLPLGYLAEKPEPKPRKPVAEVTYAERYKRPWVPDSPRRA